MDCPYYIPRPLPPLLTTGMPDFPLAELISTTLFLTKTRLTWEDTDTGFTAYKSLCHENVHDILRLCGAENGYKHLINASLNLMDIRVIDALANCFPIEGIIQSTRIQARYDIRDLRVWTLFGVIGLAKTAQLDKDPELPKVLRAWVMDAAAKALVKLLSRRNGMPELTAEAMNTMDPLSEVTNSMNESFVTIDLAQSSVLGSPKPYYLSPKFGRALPFAEHTVLPTTALPFEPTSDMEQSADQLLERFRAKVDSFLLTPVMDPGFDAFRASVGLDALSSNAQPATNATQQIHPNRTHTPVPEHHSSGAGRWDNMREPDPPSIPLTPPPRYVITNEFSNLPTGLPQGTPISRDNPSSPEIPTSLSVPEQRINGGAPTAAPHVSTPRSAEEMRPAGPLPGPDVLSAWQTLSNYFAGLVPPGLDGRSSELPMPEPGAHGGYAMTKSSTATGMSEIANAIPYPGPSANAVAYIGPSVPAVSTTRDQPDDTEEERSDQGQFLAPFPGSQTLYPVQTYIHAHAHTDTHTDLKRAEAGGTVSSSSSAGMGETAIDVPYPYADPTALVATTSANAIPYADQPAPAMNMARDHSDDTKDERSDPAQFLATFPGSHIPYPGQTYIHTHTNTHTDLERPEAGRTDSKARSTGMKETAIAVPYPYTGPAALAATTSANAIHYADLPAPAVNTMPAEADHTEEERSDQAQFLAPFPGSHMPHPGQMYLHTHTHTHTHTELEQAEAGRMQRGSQTAGMGEAANDFAYPYAGPTALMATTSANGIPYADRHATAVNMTHEHPAHSHNELSALDQLLASLEGLDVPYPAQTDAHTHTHTELDPLDRAWEDAVGGFSEIGALPEMGGGASGNGNAFMQPSGTGFYPPMNEWHSWGVERQLSLFGNAPSPSGAGSLHPAQNMNLPEVTNTVAGGVKRSFEDSAAADDDGADESAAPPKGYNPKNGKWPEKRPRA